LFVKLFKPSLHNTFYVACLGLHYSIVVCAVQYMS